MKLLQGNIKNYIFSFPHSDLSFSKHKDIYERAE